GLILQGFVGQQANLAVRLHQPHRFARRAESGFHLRADGYPLDELSQRFHQKWITLVATVEAHRLAEETRRNAKTDGWGFHVRMFRNISTHRCCQIFVMDKVLTTSRTAK